MPTPSEQKALAFLALVILLGGAVRFARSGSAPAPTPAEEQALARQASAADSAAGRTGRPKAIGTQSWRDDGAKSGRSVASSGRARGGRSRRADPLPPDSALAGIGGYPPPWPRVDVAPPPSPPPASPAYVAPYGAPLAARVARRQEPPAVVPAGPTLPPSTLLPAAQPLIDLDVATAAELDALPRVGPAMAARIVANRDSFGAFGSLAGLRRVRGMGPATLQRIAARVTFSGRAASSDAGNRYH